MAFDEETQDLDLSKNKNLRKVSSQKSIFDNAAKKPSQEDFENKVKQYHEKSIGYKTKAAELSNKFKNALLDKTLVQNKNIFANEVETELLSDMVTLAMEVNNDPNEQESMGSLMWIILLLKTSLMQRDKINELEYKIFQLEKQIKST